MHQRQTADFQLQYSPTEIEGQCILGQIATVRLNQVKFTLFVIGSVLTAGIPVLVMHWYPFLQRIFYYDYVSFQNCTHVSIINYDEQTTICQLHSTEILLDQINKEKGFLFINRYMKYFINGKKVVRALLFNQKARIQRIITQDSKGLNLTQIQEIRKCYGKGTMEIEQPAWYILTLKQLVRPLYLFLFYSVGLWIWYLYYIYSGMIFFTSVLAIGINVYQAISTNHKIFKMAFHQVNVNVLRDSQIIQISSIELVPGDVVFLKDPIKIPFQGIILQGSALINQCALTGESVPIVKKADIIDHYQNLESKIDKTSYVFQGTTIIQVNCKKKMAIFQPTRQAYGIPVCVTRTNFVTMKGQLIRIILFPKEQDNIFQRQAAKFLFLLFFIVLVTFLAMIGHLSKAMTAINKFTSFLDLVAIAVPPALPISMSLGVLYAIRKLQQKSIFCIEQNKVITGGSVSFSCFDKTGTLTEDFMDFQALVPAQKGKFFQKIQNRSQNKINISQTLKGKPYLFDIFNNMASNHSIVRIEDTGQLIGDPMEIKLLQFGQFTLNQSNSDPEVVFSFESARKQTGEVFRRFQFDSDLQRMSVICKIKSNITQCLYSYAKGSPQMMANIMQKSSIPSDYNQVLKEYASNGFRVLAIGSKKIQGTNHRQITRQMAETGLFFNGFQVFQNKLKTQTKGAIQELKDAKIGVVMITGDNPLTGSNIGYKCGISHRNKGMLICDYKDGKFYEQKFVYHPRQLQQSPSSNTTLQLAPQINQSNYYENSLTSFNSIEIANIELITKQKQIQTSQLYLSKVKQLESMIVPTSNPEQYMKNIIQLAKKMNSQLCVTGNAFNRLFQGKVEQISDLKREFLDCTTVFARTKPNDKAKIVMVYQHTGRTVSMCGDGANDCGALKQADIGLSLSQAQASISAPFTSQIANISSMVQLIKQCRAGLATNFSLFNIMASYSLTQYISTAICKIYFEYPSQYQFLYWDVACNFFFIIFVGATATVEKLSVQIPSNSLFCFSNLFQILFAFGLNVVGQISMILSLSGIFSSNIDYYSVGGFTYNQAQYTENEGPSTESPQTSILFLFSNFMYLFTLMAFSIGAPWRKPFYTNIGFTIALIILMAYSILIVMVPKSRLEIFLVKYMDDQKILGFILGLAFAFGLAILVLQKLVWEPLTLWLRANYPQKKWL